MTRKNIPDHVFPGHEAHAWCESVCSISGALRNEWIAGDRRSDCKAAALALNSNAATTVRDTITTGQMPSCPTYQANDASCKVGTDSNCIGGVPDGYKTDNEIYVYGTITGGTSCTQHPSLPANATNAVCDTKTEYAETGDGGCPAGQTTYGCVQVTSPEKISTASVLRQAGIKTVDQCRAWARAQPNQRITSDSDITCDFKVDPASVKSTILFAAATDNNSTLALGAACGDSRLAFFNALSDSDKSKIDSSTPCKIIAVNSGTASGIALSRDSTDCSAQRARDCADAKFRETCTTQTVPGSSSTITSAESPHGKAAMKATCDTKCNILPNGFCEAYSNQNITIKEYFNAKYGATTNRAINCIARPQAEKTPPVDAFEMRLESQIPSFCPASDSGVPRYYIQNGSAYSTNSAVDEFVSGTLKSSAGVLSPEKNLIEFIKAKITEKELNAIFTVFIRKTGESAGTGNGIDYIGTNYEKLVQDTKIKGQAYSVTASSYAAALRSLSSEIKSRLIRSFTVRAIDPSRHVITKVTIVRNNGSQTLAIGEWTQAGNSITVAENIAFDEGDKIIVEYQNNDGYIKDQLKKIFVIDEMRPEQIVLSVDHIKNSGETVSLRTDQWLKDGNRILIDPSVVINGGDKFRVRFKNNTTEE